MGGGVSTGDYDDRTPDFGGLWKEPSEESGEEPHARRDRTC